MNPSPTPDYQRNLADDTFLEALNQRVEQAELDSYRDLEEEYPTIHILGVPRSGTTLALQLLAGHTDVRYVDHVAAAFWRAPVTGLRLSAALRRQVPRHSSYRSDFGRTQSLTEPHEFSYLWARLFGTEFGLESLREPSRPESVDWEFFKRVITNMCDAVAGPIVFKSFHAIWHLRALCEALPKTVVVVVKREPIAVAQSLVKMRERLYGSREAWASVKPREYELLKDADYATQIAGQIHYVGEAIDQGINDVDRDALIEVDYRDLCREPAAFLERVVEVVAAKGFRLRTVDPPSGFAESDDRQDPETVEALEAALARFGLSETASALGTSGSEVQLP
jgi:hypothetical protein